MKAILVTEPQKMSLVDVPEPELIDPHSVKVKMTAVGICGSDVHIVHGTHPYVKYPRIIGHEGAGVVAETGSAVTGLKAGDPVVVEAVQYCGTCYPCRMGRTNICEHLKVLGVHVSGTYEEYMVLPARHVFKYDPCLSPEEAVLAEPYTIGAQANARAGTLPGDLVLIHGAGPIGLITCDIAHAMGATCIVSDVNDGRLKLARDFGAAVTVNPLKEDLALVVSALSQDSGANVIFDAAGAPGLIESALEMASQAGRVVPMTFGSRPVPLNFGLVNKKELIITGTRMECGRFPLVVNTLPDRRERLRKLVTHVFPIEEYGKAFATSQDPASEACKVVMTF